MKTFIKTVMAVSILAASLGAVADTTFDNSVANSAGDYNGNAAYDLRNRLEGVYDNFGSSFVKTSSTLNSYGELLYIIDNQRDDYRHSDELSINFDQVTGYVSANEPDIISIDGLDVNDINESVDRFVAAVNVDLFGNAEQGGYGNDGLSNGNEGLIGNALNVVVDHVAAYNVSAQLDEDGGQAALDTFNGNFRGPDGFESNFNGAIDVLTTVSTELNTGDSEATAYSAYKLGADTTTTFLANGTVDVFGTVGGVVRGTDDTNELDAGAEAYAYFLAHGNNGTISFDQETRVTTRTASDLSTFTLQPEG